jgi:hypothetical protein
MRSDLLDPLRSPDMPRRAFLAAIAGGLLVVPLAADAQQAGKVSTVGLLSVGTSRASSPRSSSW